MPIRPEQRVRWEELSWLLNEAQRQGIDRLELAEVKRLCRLYRLVTIDLSRARLEGEDPELIGYLNLLAARAHGCVYRARAVDLRPLFAFLISGFPRQVRRCARAILIASAFFLLPALASCVAVLRQPELAYSLFDEHVVEFENIRLENEHGEYKGNFTFTVADSPLAALAIIANNIKVAILMFAFGALCCVPGVLLLTYNGRMLGTLSGMVWNHGHLIDFYALILTHGVLELTAFCIAGAGGLLLGWALIAPGPRPRKQALRQASSDAFGLLAGSVFMLIVAGVIEAHITPHFSQPVRWSVAASSTLLLILYFGFAGRGAPASNPSS